VFDSSVLPAGWLPLRQGRNGNVATEMWFYMLNGMGIETGIDLDL